MSNNKNKEIERKFLIDLSMVELENCRSVIIRQGYLCFEEDREVRLREIDGKFLMTYKRGGGKVRDEIEFEISPDVFKNLWPQTENRRLEKQRYYLEYNGYTVEIDCYMGSLEGLSVAEVEFETESECKSFKMPYFFLKDISGVSVYRNRTLIFKGIPEELKYDY